jgi:hypothetical protein
MQEEGKASLGDSTAEADSENHPWRPEDGRSLALLSVIGSSLTLSTRREN